MVPRVILHIGLEKTGSTSIQVALRDNPDQLAAQGIYFDQAFTPKSHLGTGNSLGLTAAALTGGKKERFLKGREAWQLTTSFDEYPKNGAAVRSDAKLVIFSSEHLSSWVTEHDEIERLRSFIRRFCDEISVIAYLRRHDRLAQSLINEQIKSGGVFSYKNVDRLLGVNSPKLRFVEPIGRYRDVFGAENVILRHFSRAHMIDGDVVQDLLSIMGAGEISLEPPSQSNASLTLEALYVLSLLNDFQSVFGNLDSLRKARRTVLEKGRGRLAVVSRARARKVCAMYSADCAELARMTGTGKFFDDRFDDFPEAVAPIDPETVRVVTELPAVARALEQCLGMDARPNASEENP